MILRNVGIAGVLLGGLFVGHAAHEIELKGGKTISGEIVSENESFFVIDRGGSELKVLKSLIVSVDGKRLTGTSEQAEQTAAKQPPASQAAPPDGPGAAPDKTKQAIVLKNGTTLNAVIVSQNANFYRLDMDGTKLNILKTLVARIDGKAIGKKEEAVETPAPVVATRAARSPTPVPPARPPVPAKSEGARSPSPTVKSAPDASSAVTIALKNGNVLEGRLISENPNFVTIDVDGATLRVLKSMIEATGAASSPAKSPRSPQAVAAPSAGDESMAPVSSVGPDDARVKKVPKARERTAKEGAESESPASVAAEPAEPKATQEPRDPLASGGTQTPPAAVEPEKPAQESDHAKVAAKQEPPKEKADRRARRSARRRRRAERKAPAAAPSAPKTVAAAAGAVTSTAAAKGGTAAVPKPVEPVASAQTASPGEDQQVRPAKSGSTGKEDAGPASQPAAGSGDEGAGSVEVKAVPKAKEKAPPAEAAGRSAAETPRVAMAATPPPHEIKPAEPDVKEKAREEAAEASRRKPGFVYPEAGKGSAAKPAPAGEGTGEPAKGEKDARVSELVLRTSRDEEQLLEAVPREAMAVNTKEKVEGMAPTRREYLAKQLESAKPPERVDAAVELGKTQAPWAAELLADALADETALSAVAGGEEVLNAPTSVGEAVARTLGMMGTAAFEPVEKALGHRNKAVRRNAVVAMALIGGEQSTRALVDALKDDDLEVQFTAMTELTERKPVALLIEGVNSRNANLRKNAIEILGEIREKSAADYVIVALTDRNSSVREKAARAIGLIGDPRAGDALLKCMQDGISFVRRNAAFALGEIREAKAVDVLIKALKDESPFVRRSAARALGKLRDTRAIEPLVQASKDPDPDVAAAAANALHLHTDIGSLIKGLDDDSPVVQKNAEYALFLMTGQDHGSDHQKWKQWWAGKTGVAAGAEER